MSTPGASPRISASPLSTDIRVAVAPGDRAFEDVVVAHEGRHLDVVGQVRDRERVGDLLDAAFVHDDDPVADGQRLLLVVRHVDEHQAELALERSQLHPHPQPQEAVEVAERLVQQQGLRFHHEHAGQRHPLLLAARERARLAVRHRPQADHVEGAPCLLAALLLRDAAHLRPELHVLQHRPVGEEREVLEDGGGRALVRREPEQTFSVQEDVPTRRLLVSADHPERRRLPAARGPEQNDVLAVGDVQVDVVHGGEVLAEPLGQAP